MELLTSTVSPAWHASCALVVSTFAPFAAALALVGFSQDIDWLIMSFFGVLLVLFPFIGGLDIAARSIVSSLYPGLDFFGREAKVASVRLRLMSMSEVSSSMHRLGLNYAGVFLLRRIVWVSSAAFALIALIVAALVPS
jgi:hypothetical protein